MSYGIYVGKNLTADGVAFIGGYGDEPSSHWLEVIPRQQHEDNAKIVVGVTPNADMPGLLKEISQVKQSHRHIRVSYSFYKGTPTPLTNGGLNEYGVAVRDIWSPSRPELLAMTPPTQTGPNYSDLARIILERAHSAREGVQLIADLISRYGHTTYGGNSHIIADSNEAWVVIQFAGGQGLWVAERLGPDSIRASRPGYIEELPLRPESSDDYLYSSNFVSFAVSQGWYDPNKSSSFNVNEIYGDGKGKWAGVKWIEDELLERATSPDKIRLEDIMWAVRTERLTGDTAGYGQVIPLMDTDFNELRLIWHTQVGAIAAPFVPVFMGVQEIPEEFRMHRYLTDGEAERTYDTRCTADRNKLPLVPQGIESTRSASYVYKRLLNLIFQSSDNFLVDVIPIWEQKEKELINTSNIVSKSCQVLLSSNERQLATDYLTYFTRTELLGTLDTADKIGQYLEIKTKSLFGIRNDILPIGPKQLW